MYHTTCYRACVVTSITDEDRDQDDQDEDQVLTLTAGVAENKRRGRTDSDALGQLLDEMDKVAGDLAYRTVVNASLSEEERVFQCI